MEVGHQQKLLHYSGGGEGLRQEWEQSGKRGETETVRRNRAW